MGTAELAVPGTSLEKSTGNASWERLRVSGSPAHLENMGLTPERVLPRAETPYDIPQQPLELEGPWKASMYKGSPRSL